MHIVSAHWPNESTPLMVMVHGWAVAIDTLEEVEGVLQSESYKAQLVSGQYVNAVCSFEFVERVVVEVVENSTTSWRFFIVARASEEQTPAGV